MIYSSHSFIECYVVYYCRIKTEIWNHSMAAQPGADNIPSFKVCILYCLWYSVICATTIIVLILFIDKLYLVTTSGLDMEQSAAARQWQNRVYVVQCCIPPLCRHQLPAEQLTIYGTPLPSVNTVLNLGVHLDSNSNLSMVKLITQLVNSCFAALRQIRSIQYYLPRYNLSTPATSFIMTRIDYCNVILTGLPQCKLWQLQTVVNAAARLTAGAQKHGHITPLLKDLHSLRVPERITYKLCALTFRCLNGL